MLKCRLCVPLAVLLLALVGQSTSAQSSHDYLEVVSVETSREIKHDVELKGAFDDKVVLVDLTGPKLFSHAVGMGDVSASEPRAFMNWYSITNPESEAARTIEVRDLLHGKESYKINVGKPSYLLSLAQMVTTGTPSEIPENLDYFKAYAIDNSKSVERDITLKGTLGPEKRTVLKAAFLCVPVEHWHHHDHTPIKNANRCFVVYELQPSKLDKAITTIDQFGLNKLKAQSSAWLCVRAEIVQ